MVNDLNNQIPKKKSSAKIIMIVVVVIIILIVAYFAYSFLMPLSTKEKAIKKCIEDTSYNCNAFFSDDENWCDKTNSNCIYLYTLGKSIRENDINACSNMLDGMEKEFCEALFKKDSSFCEKLDTEKKDCMIVVQRNRDLCPTINDSAMNGFCLMITTQEKEHCENVTKICEDMEYVELEYVETGGF